MDRTEGVHDGPNGAVLSSPQGLLPLDPPMCLTGATWRAASPSDIHSTRRPQMDCSGQHRTQEKRLQQQVQHVRVCEPIQKHLGVGVPGRRRVGPDQLVPTEGRLQPPAENRLCGHMVSGDVRLASNGVVRGKVHHECVALQQGGCASLLLQRQRHGGRGKTQAKTGCPLSLHGVTVNPLVPAFVLRTPPQLHLVDGRSNDACSERKSLCSPFPPTQGIVDGPCKETTDQIDANQEEASGCSTLPRRLPLKIKTTESLPFVWAVADKKRGSLVCSGENTNEAAFLETKEQEEENLETPAVVEPEEEPDNTPAASEKVVYPACMGVTEKPKTWDAKEEDVDDTLAVSQEGESPDCVEVREKPDAYSAEVDVGGGREDGLQAVGFSASADGYGIAAEMGDETAQTSDNCDTVSQPQDYLFSATTTSKKMEIVEGAQTAIAAACAPAKGGEKHFRLEPGKGDCRQERLSGQAYGTSKETLRCYLHQLTTALSNLLQHVGNEKLQEKGTSGSLPRPREGSTPTTPQKNLLFSPTRSLHEDRGQMTRPTVSVSQAAPLGRTGAGGLILAGLSPSPSLPQKTDGRPRPSVAFSPLHYSEQQQPVRLQGSGVLSRRAAATAAAVQSATARRRRYVAGGNPDAIVRVQLPLLVSRNSSSRSADPLRSAVETPGCSSLFRRTTSVCARLGTPGATSPSAAGTTIAATRVPKPSRTSWTSAAPRLHAGKAAFQRLSDGSVSPSPAASLFDANRSTRYFSGPTTTSIPLPRSKWSCISSAVCEKETWTPSAHQQRTCQSLQHQQVEGWMSAVADATGGVLATATGGTEQQGRGTETASEWRNSSNVKEDGRRARDVRSRIRTEARSRSVRWRTGNEEGSGTCRAELRPSEDWASESCAKQGTSKPSVEWGEDMNREVDAGKLVSSRRMKQLLRTSGRRMQPRIVGTMGEFVVVPTNRRRGADRKMPETPTLGGSPRAEREDMEKLGEALEETQQAAGSPRSEGQQTARSRASAEPGRSFSVEGEAEPNENTSPLASLSPPPEGCTQPPAAAAVVQSHAASRRSSEGDAPAEEEGLADLAALERPAEAAAAAARARCGDRGADRRMLLQEHSRRHLLDDTPTAAAAETEAKSSPCLSHAALTPSPVTPKPRQPQEIDCSFGGAAGATLPARSCPAATLLRRRSNSFIACLGAHLNAGAQTAAAPTPVRAAASAAATGTALLSAATAGEPLGPPAEKGGRAAAGAAAASTLPPTAAPAATSAIVRTPAAAAATSPRDRVVPVAVSAAGAAAAQQHRGLTLGEGGQQLAASATKPRGSPTAGGQQQHVPLMLEEKCPLSPLPSPRSSLKDARRQLRLPDQQAAACFSRVSGVFPLCEQCRRGRAPPVQQHLQQPAVESRTPGENGEGAAGEAVRRTRPGARRPEAAAAAADALPASAAVTGETVASLADMASSRGRREAGGRAAGTAETHVPAGTAEALEERRPLRTTPLAAAGAVAGTSREERGKGTTEEDLSETEERGTRQLTGEVRTATASGNSRSLEGAITAQGATGGKILMTRELRKKCGGLPSLNRGERDEPGARVEDPARETEHRISQRKPDQHQQLRQQQTRRTKRRSRRNSSKMRARSSTWSSRSRSTDSCELTRSCRKRSDAAAAAACKIEGKRNSTSSCSKPPRETQAVCPLVGSNGTRSRGSRNAQSTVDHWKADADSEGDATWGGRPRQWGSCSSSSEEEEEENHGSSTGTSWNSRTSCRTANRRGRDSYGAERRSSRVTESSSVRDEEGRRSSWTRAAAAQRRRDTPYLRAVTQDSDQLELHTQQKEQLLWLQEKRKESVSTSAGLHSYRSAASMRLLSHDSVGGDMRQLQVSIGHVKNVYIHGEEKAPKWRAFCVAYTQNDDLHSLIRRRKQRTRTVRVEQESDHVFFWAFNEKVLLPYDPLQAGVRVAVLQLLFDEDLVDVAPALEDLHYRLLGVTPLLLWSCFLKEEDGEQPAEDAGGKDEHHDFEEKQCWSLLCPDDPAASTGEMEVRLRLLPARPAESHRHAAGGASAAASQALEGGGEESLRNGGSSRAAHEG